MRPMLVVASSLVLLGCAHAPQLPDGAEIASLSPDQLRQAFDGKGACIIREEDGACESMILVDSISSRTIRFRSVGATDIAKFVDEPMTQFIRELPMFAQYADLFSSLEAQRARGAFRYLKAVIPSTETLEPRTQRWCSRSDGTLDGAKFYFSNALSTAVERDQPLDVESEGRFQAFLVAVLNDPSVRAAVEPDPEMRAWLDGFREAVEACTQYSGIVTEGRIEIRGVSITIDGAEISFLRNTIRPYPLGGDLPLRAN